ncbi:MAG: hypothetical protein HQK52_12220 [Oligoflexia bacterium]|nr:hypothetical protein [Oligoflexia bacterium]
MSIQKKLKVAYTGIQTIGIINIGRSIYRINSPSIEGSFYELLSNKEKMQYTSPELAGHLLQIFAQEERAKRVALFYSSSFLSGVNAIIAIYSAFYKGNYEKYYYGPKIDIRPILYHDENGQKSAGGLEVGLNF